MIRYGPVCLPLRSITGLKLLKRAQESSRLSAGDADMKAPEIKPKQEYRPPKLHIYGDLTEMTKAGARGGKNDHGGGDVKTT